jgi:predicted MFS family arabinose efflux permease
MAPYVLVQGLGGPLIDRLSAWRVSIWTDVAAAAAIGVIPLLHGADALSFWLLCALVGLAGAVRGAGDSARYVIVPGATEQARQPLERGAGLSDGVERLAGLLGAPVAGVLIAVTSVPVVLAIDAITFLASALLVRVFVPSSASPPSSFAVGALGESKAGQRRRGISSYLDQLREGFAYVRGDRLLLGIGVMILVTNFIDHAVGSVLMPVYASTLPGGPVALGLLAGAFGFGAVVGNAILTWLSPRLPRRSTYAWCFLLCGAPRLFAMAATTAVSPVLVVFLLAGLGAGGINPILGAVEYERVPRPLQARVLGALGALAWVGIPFGSLAGGLSVAHIGLRPTLLIGGVIYLLATAAPFVFPAWRGMDRRVAAAVREA